jgi:hypothetical protein
MIQLLGDKGELKNYKPAKEAITKLRQVTSFSNK